MKAVFFLFFSLCLTATCAAGEPDRTTPSTLFTAHTRGYEDIGDFYPARQVFRSPVKTRWLVRTGTLLKADHDSPDPWLHRAAELCLFAMFACGGDSLDQVAEFLDQDTFPTTMTLQDVRDLLVIDDVLSRKETLK